MIGRTLSHFRITAKIGEGGMGVVYRAEDENLRRPVAFKVLPPELIGNEERRLRFLREARAAAAVSHPNIATIYEVGEEDGVVFIAMELVEGRTLREALGGRPLPIKDAVRLATEMAEGMAAAHQAKVVHRDLKPDNVVVAASGHVKILDFGLAKLLQERAAAGADDLSRLRTISAEMTREGKVLGTAAYMSPEQARGQPLDARSDIFSFGTTLYEMATGRVPFEGTTATDVLSAIVRDEPVPASRRNPEVPAEMERIIGECLEKDPEDRYQHTDQLVVDLRKLRRKTDSGVQAVRTPTGPLAAEREGAARRLLGQVRRRPLVSATAVLVLAVAIAGSWWRSGRQPHLSPGDTIIVADFENATGVTGLESAVRDAFEVCMGESSYHPVIIGESLDDLRQASGVDAGSRLDAAAAARICSKGGCAGYLTGRIAREGGGYRLEAALYAVASAEPVIGRTREVREPSDLLQAVYEVATEMRLGLGENPRVVAMRSPISTRSLPAFQALAAALRTGDPLEQITLYKRALQRDPGFTHAMFFLSVDYANLGDWKQSARWAEEAHRRSGGLPEIDRLFFESNYLETIYEFDADIERLRSFERLYPLHKVPSGWLGSIYDFIQQDPVAAEPAYRRTYGNSPVPPNMGNVAGALFAQGKRGEIEALLKDFRARGGAESAADEERVWLHILDGNRAGLEEVVERLSRTPGRRKAWVTAMQGRALLKWGRLGEARPAAGEALRAASEARQADLALEMTLLQSWLDGRTTGRGVALSREQIRPADTSFIYIPTLALASVEMNLPEPLGTLVREHEADLRQSTSRFVKEELQFARGCLALIGGKADGAVALLAPLARNAILLRRHHVLALAYERLGRWREAAGEYEEVLKYPYRSFYLVNPAFWAIDQFRAAQVYERLGDAARARQWYGRFLEDWKDADPDIPEVIEARKRLLALGGATG